MSSDCLECMILVMLASALLLQFVKFSGYFLLDYYFLEDVGRLVDAAHRKRLHRQGQLKDDRKSEQRVRKLIVHHNPDT